MPTTREVLNGSIEMMAPIPQGLPGSICRACRGPVTNYELCYACHELFRTQGAPAALSTAIAPITAALNPGKWYTWLQTYKTYHTDRGAVIVSLIYEFIEAHQDRVEEALGGAPTLTTIVPSKRGYTFATQPFRRTLGMVEEMSVNLTEVLRFQPGQTIGRREYKPHAFSLTADVSGSRVLLLEDTWVTGATALSAAGNLLGAGAAKVLILPAARMVEQAHWPADHPYLTASQRPVEPLNPKYWPRG